jgi:hypothetical protein
MRHRTLKKEAIMGARPWMTANPSPTRSPTRWLLGLIVALSTNLALAKECVGVKFDDERSAAGQTLKLNGLGLRQATMFKVNVYVAGLYAAAPSKDANALLAANTPKLLVLHFVRDVGARDLREAWEEGFEHNAKDRVADFKARIEKLQSWMADMSKGQTLTFLHKPGAGVEVVVNGKARGTLEGDDFARAFLSIWLGANPPNAELKTGLLGGACA